MTEDDVASRIRGIKMPEQYVDYYADLSSRTRILFEKAAEAKSGLMDSSASVESMIAFDLADRVAKMHEIDIAQQLRDLLKTNGKEFTALRLSQEIAMGKHLPGNTSLKDRLDLAVRVGLAIVTEGVTVAPLQGISDVSIERNKDGTEYLSVSIAGPMRSAGGTESAVTMLIADHVRKAVGLGTYQANSFDDETGRFVEELRTYEREGKQGFQYKVLDEDIVTTISNLPVELNGTDTDPFEVVNHRGMARIKTDRVRGGALRVLNDGLIGRSKKLLKRIELYNLSGWEWLGDLKGAIQTGESTEDAASKRMKEIIMGRSYLSTPEMLGGFRLRYGRSCNTGFTTVGFHPAVAEMLDHTIAVGTQIKTDIPGKGGVVAFVDSIETPTVRLDNGDVIKIRDVAHALEIKPRIARILHLGDVLISFGDFLENNARLVPSGYVEEIWTAELEEIVKTDSPEREYLTRIPSLDESVRLSLRTGIPLHPKYLYYWEMLSHDEFDAILSPLETGTDLIRYDASCKRVLEKLAVPHTAGDSEVLLKGVEAATFFNLLFKNPVRNDRSLPVPILIQKFSGVPIRNKFSTSVGVRIGRPEKAAPRQTTPPIHCLFPVGEKGGVMRDMLKASHQSDFYTNISNRICSKCNEPSLSIRCQECATKTTLERVCPNGHPVPDEPLCKACGKRAFSYAYRPFPLKKRLMEAQRRVGLRAQVPLKGVKELISQDRVAEPLEKGILRRSRNLTIFKDGTVRFDATNCTLTHFRPSWIGTAVEKLRQLGYMTDMHGADLTDPEQTVELKMQDIVIPIESGIYLVEACKYVDAELEKFYEKSTLYNVKETDDLLGHLVVGLAPHTSVGVVARIIGYTKTHVCFGTPNWHSAKRRDADGDADSIMLLADAFLNFSRQFLSSKIGGLMDAPLLIQPLVLPHESQPQAHNLEVTKALPLEFYGAAASRKKASEARSVEIIKSRLESGDEFEGYHFTHPTATLTTSKPRSAYSTLGSMLDKFDFQIKNAEMIEAVDTVETVSNLITTHLVPDIMGNLRTYARQSFRCTKCGRKYRRPPLPGRCDCKHNLIQTITRASVEKYLKLARRLVEKYDVSEYQRGRILLLSDEIDLLFGKNAGNQTLLSDFAN